MLKVGDIINFCFGMPGPDYTHGIVLYIDGDNFSFYDLGFEMIVEGKLSEKDIYGCGNWNISSKDKLYDFEKENLQTFINKLTLWQK